jgi:hypothetical protein
MQQRFRKSGKEKLIVLILTDFDPDGEEIAHSFVRSMRDDFDVPVEGVKVALTSVQVRELNLPPMMQAKAGSANYTKFTSEHGHDVFELEAIPPDKLQELLEDAIDRVIDKAAFNAELDAEKSDAAFLSHVRRRVRAVLRNARMRKEPNDGTSDELVGAIGKAADLRDQLRVSSWRTASENRPHDKRREKSPA